MPRKAKLGSGKRFAKLEKQVGSPELAAWIGKKKWGEKRMNKLSHKNRKDGRK